MAAENKTKGENSGEAWLWEQICLAYRGTWKKRRLAICCTSHPRGGSCGGGSRDRPTGLAFWPCGLVYGGRASGLAKVAGVSGEIGDAARSPESCCSGLALQPLRSSDLLTLPTCCWPTLFKPPMAGFQILLLPPAPIRSHPLPSRLAAPTAHISFSAACETNRRSKYRERLTCATGLEQALQGCSPTVT